MRPSQDHILTSHAGSPPRPDDLIDANRARESGGATDERRFQDQLRSSVAEVVRRQRELGIDVPGDGEFGKAMGHRVNYRAWWSYSFQRLSGLELGTTGLYDLPPRRSRPGDVVLTSFADRRDRLRFAAAYADPESGITTGPRPALWPVRVEALNHAIRGLPRDRIRFHLCWGSWHGPHTTDIPLRDIVDVMLAVDCSAYSFEAANVRHEHEWRVWKDVTLPDGKLIVQGIVSHATNVVEHP